MLLINFTSDIAKLCNSAYITYFFFNLNVYNVEKMCNFPVWALNKKLLARKKKVKKVFVYKIWKEIFMLTKQFFYGVRRKLMLEIILRMMMLLVGGVEK